MEEILTMVMNLMNKGMYFLLFISSLYSLRHLILFSTSVVKSKKYEITKKELIYLGVSISVILTIIFSGIKLI